MLTKEGMKRIVNCFVDAAMRALRVGFDVIGVHGSLISSFSSPTSKDRTDGYGGDFVSRARAVLEVIDVVRAVNSPTMPLLLRNSASKWLTVRGVPGHLVLALGGHGAPCGSARGARRGPAGRAVEKESSRAEDQDRADVPGAFCGGGEEGARTTTVAGRASDTNQVSTLHLCITTAMPTNHPFETEHVYETRYINAYTVVPTIRPPALCHLHTASNMRPH